MPLPQVQRQTTAGKRRLDHPARRDRGSDAGEQDEREIKARVEGKSPTRLEPGDVSIVITFVASLT